MIPKFFFTFFINKIRLKNVSDKLEKAEQILYTDQICLLYFVNKLRNEWILLCHYGYQVNGLKYSDIIQSNQC